MATLDPSNIVNGNTVEANDLLQLYQAFGTGSGASITGLAMTGSLYGNALTATTATTSTSASNITTAITGGGTHYLTFVAGSGTKAPKIASLLEYNAANNNLTVTASYATVAENAGWDGLYSYGALAPIYSLNQASSKILITNTGMFPQITAFPGYSGQVVEFITEPTALNIDLTQLAITASGISINGLDNGRILPGSSDVVSNILGGSGVPNNVYSFKMLYQTTSWQLIF